jgi:dTDP-4-dehydrorhamnose reductase
VEEHGSLTLRTSIIGRQLSGQSGLIEWLMTQRGGRIKGFTRAIYSGLTTHALCHIIDKLIEQHHELSGIWQMASEPINKFDLITWINNRLDLGITIERDENFICDRSLDGSHFNRVTGLIVPSWEAMIEEFARDNINYNWKN